MQIGRTFRAQIFNEKMVQRNSAAGYFPAGALQQLMIIRDDGQPLYGTKVKSITFRDVNFPDKFVTFTDGEVKTEDGLSTDKTKLVLQTNGTTNFYFVDNWYNRIILQTFRPDENASEWVTVEMVTEVDA